MMKKKLRQVYVQSATYLKHVNHAMDAHSDEMFEIDVQVSDLLTYTAARDELTQKLGRKNKVPHLSLAMSHYARTGQDALFSHVYMGDLTSFKESQIMVILDSQKVGAKRARLEQQKSFVENKITRTQLIEAVAENQTHFSNLQDMEALIEEGWFSGAEKPGVN